MDDMNEVLDQPADYNLTSEVVPVQVSERYFLRPTVQSELAALPERLILLVAPAGFGKTTELAVLANKRVEQGQCVAWLTLTAESNTSLIFFQQLAHTLESVQASLGDFDSALTDNSACLDTLQVMELVLGNILRMRKSLLLVLDDFEAISNPDLLSAIDRLINYAPDGFTLAIGSRVKPKLSLATWRAKGYLVEIGERELRLSEDDTRVYLQLHGLNVEPLSLKKIYSYTEGWMTGVLQVIKWLKSTPQKPDALLEYQEDHTSVGKYLSDAVFEGLPVERQDALLNMSVVHRFNGSLVQALTGCDNGQQLLEDLEVMQLFLVPLDSDRRWFRFHRFFAEFLRARLKQQDPERFKQIHFNASLWFTNNHMQNFAIEHAYHAQDVELLAALVDGCGLSLINRGQLSLVHKWRQHVPDDIAVKYPVLVLTDLWVRVVDLGLDEANRALDDLLLRWGDSDSKTQLTDSMLAALAIKSLIALQKDDLRTCVKLARRVELQLGSRTAFLEVAMLVIGAFANVMMGWHDAARKLLTLANQRNHFLDGNYLQMQLINVEVMLLLEQGKIKQAELLFERLRERTTSWFNEKSKATVLPKITQCLIAYQQGRFEGVTSLLKRMLSIVDVISPVDLCAQGTLCLAHLQYMQGNTKEAHSTLIYIQNLAARNKAWRFYAQAVGYEILRTLQEAGDDRTKRAEQRLKSINWNELASNYAHMRLNPVLWVQGLSRTRLQQARGHYSEAIHEILQLRGMLQDDWEGLEHIRLDLLAAHSYQQLGYQERSQSLLVQCLIAAEREEVRSLFLEEGEPIRNMLHQLEMAERQPALQNFIRSLLALWPGQSAQRQLEVIEEELTEREQEVIRLAAQGMSNNDIGQQLNLALGTVKWHLHNIYEKLKVRNRTQAIRRARELGMLGS
ncbi:LuxR family transcriptional regulator, maltose regulon positive regulatory protein [Pseudomonas segetis]|uniref:LuxR family transcriptional regulator, maltose regulon positive regulatory protein n=2 Tax=Pseudomonas segetis TaxID=298908 RepID=A0A239AEU5_9PSED|nr:LuxR C-terminal-related transcriptional regulator [Pseudomonas segetis]SNR94105.1 LuxR family transcriptional regulator, maltose regulon positive regulatory protein [Pseudomonas segetis]